MMNLSITLEHSARENPHKTAIVFGDQRFNYIKINALANQIANSLVINGIGKGDRIVLCCPNFPYFPIIYFGILKTGAVVIPISILLKNNEIEYLLKDSGAKAFFCFEGSSELPMGKEGYAGFCSAESCKHFWIITTDPKAPSPIEGIQTIEQMVAGQSSEFHTVQCSTEDTAVILYTSGTTGFPKGAELTHSNIIMNVNVCSEMFQLTRNDVQAVAVPMFHAFGQIIQMACGFSKENTLVLIPRFSPEAVLSVMQKEKITVFAGVPTMYWQILNYNNKEGKFDIKLISDTLRLGISGGSALPLEIKRGFEEKYKIAILEGYGLSETSPAVSFNQLHKPQKAGSIGTPVWGVEVKVFNEKSEEIPIGEIGEIVVRGHNVMKGYYNKPEATKAAFKGTGWFHTGDLGKMDEDGYFYIVDRVKDMIIRGGFNVYPREVEEVLMNHPAVSLAAVIGVPDDQHGEQIKAYIVLKQGKNVTEKEMIEWSKKQMAAYKYPRIVELRKTLPMTATGKILKKDLKAEVAAN
jgi:long-chain acyl-CoA synthetase